MDTLEILSPHVAESLKKQDQLQGQMFATLTHVGQAQYQQPSMESVHVNVHLDCLATLISGVDQTASNGVCTCKCPSGLSGNPYLECRPECVLNSDCDRTQACASNKCVDPCPGTVALGLNVESSTYPETTSVAHTATKGSNHYQCSCLKGYIGAPPKCRPECVVSSDCSQDTAYQQQKCSDLCVGARGYNARCQAVGHNAICTCPKGYTGDPFSGCSLIPQVITRPPQVIDPCNPSPCGSNAQCSSRNRAGACKCIPDHTGDPYVGCRPECLINTECPNSLTCMQKVSGPLSWIMWPQCSVFCQIP